MKVRAGTAAAALAVGQAAAQAAYPSPSTTSGPSTSYTTITMDDCPTGSFSTYLTVTGSVTITYCPECESATKPPSPGYTTTYTTVYQSLCPTGVVPATYTVTESCTDATPTWTPGSSHIPNGFTVTTKHCSACEEGSKSVTITEPCGCEATEGVTKPAATSAPAKATNPVQQISDGQVQAPTPGSNGGKGDSPAPTPTGSPAPECNGDDCGGSGNQTPSSTPECNGEDCGGSGSQSPSGSTPSNNGGSGSGSTPSQGGSSPAGSSSAGSGSGSSPSSPASSECNGSDCGGSGSQSPAASPSGRPVSTGALPSDVAPTGPTSSITPYEGAANRAFAASLALTVVVGALAVML